MTPNPDDQPNPERQEDLKNIPPLVMTNTSACSLLCYEHFGTRRQFKKRENSLKGNFERKENKFVIVKIED